MDTLDKKRNIIREAAQMAGKYIKTAEPQAGIIQKEGRGNFVTAADLASEKIIIDLIKTHFPQDEILSEETKNEITNVKAAEALWVIDPIDGTNNFAHQRNYSCVSIGYVEKGITKLGAVYNPFVDEFFFAEKGKGAFLNGKKIQIGNETNLTQGCVCTDNSYNPSVTQHHVELLLKIQPLPFLLLKGSAALIMCDIAAGRVDLYFHTAMYPWDIAAALLVIQEAGGIAKNFSGETITFDSPEVIVGNEALVQAFLSSIKDPS